MAFPFYGHVTSRVEQRVLKLLRVMGRSRLRPSVLALLMACVGGGRVHGQCVERQKLTASDAGARDVFGYSVAISGDTALIGAQLDDCADGADCGSAYVFRFDGVSWVEEQKLTASDAAESDSLGFAVSVNGGVAVVGAPGDDCVEGATCGAAYVFRFDGSMWVEEQKLTGSDTGGVDAFGRAVSVEGDTAVVGASSNACAAGERCGAAYVFHFNGRYWAEERKLTAWDAHAGDHFGTSVSLNADRVLVGSVWDRCAAGDECGAAYLFRFNGIYWFDEQKLTPTVRRAYEGFGVSVALSGDTAVVGAYRTECGGGTFLCGAAYAFGRHGSRWSASGTWRAAGPEAGDVFGWSVSSSGRAVAVGAPGDRCAGGSDCGAAYVFRQEGHTWIREPILVAFDGAPGDRFGRSISVSGDTVLVGASDDACAAGRDCGAAYVFSCGPIRASLDVKPGSCPNVVNPRSRGVVPVAVVGTAEFDVAAVVPESLSLVLARGDGVGDSVWPLSGPPGPGMVIEDVASPFVGEGCGCHELGGDGIEDLLLKFSTSEMREALELDALGPGAVVEVVLRGALDDGPTFEARDCMVIPGADRPGPRRGRARGSK